MLYVLFADKELGGTAVEHCSDSLSIDLGLDPEVVSIRHYFTDITCRNGVVYTYEQWS